MASFLTSLYQAYCIKIKYPARRALACVIRRKGKKTSRSFKSISGLI